MTSDDAKWTEITKRDDVVALRAFHLTLRPDPTFPNAIFFDLIQSNAPKCLDDTLRRFPTIPVNGANHVLETPFAYAVNCAHYECAKVLLKHSNTRYINLGMPNSDPRRDRRAVRAPLMQLMTEVGVCNVDFVRQLIQHRPPIDLNQRDWNCSDTEYSTPLIFAVRHEHFEIVHCLLAEGDRVDVHARDIKNRTALHYGAWSDAVNTDAVSIGVIKALLDVGIDKNVKDWLGKVAADYSNDQHVKRLINTYVPNRHRGASSKEKKNAVVKKVEKSASSSSNVNVTVNKSVDQKKHQAPAKSAVKNPVAEKKTRSKATTKENTVPTTAIVSNLNNHRFPSSSRTVCKNCLSKDAVVDIQLQPCNHVVLCVNCRDEARKNKLFKCPACRQRVFSYLKIRIG